MLLVLPVGLHSFSILSLILLCQGIAEVSFDIDTGDACETLLFYTPHIRLVVAFLDVCLLFLNVSIDM